MKQRKVILLFMFLVSMFVLITTVVPHHHHNGLTCFHVFATEHTDAGSDTENCGCLSMPAVHLTGGSHADHETFCNHFPAFTLLADLVTCCLYISERTLFSESPVFIESLHDARISCAVGLRAPPVSA